MTHHHGGHHDMSGHAEGHNLVEASVIDLAKICGWAAREIGRLRLAVIWLSVAAFGLLIAVIGLAVYR